MSEFSKILPFPRLASIPRVAEVDSMFKGFPRFARVYGQRVQLPAPALVLTPTLRTPIDDHQIK
jgi:hypothetical protein